MLFIYFKSIYIISYFIPLTFPLLPTQRNGANFSVFLNSASEWDGSDSGARPDEAISWGKIRLDATPVKVWRPLILSALIYIQVPPAVWWLDVRYFAYTEEKNTRINKNEEKMLKLDKKKTHIEWIRMEKNIEINNKKHKK